MKIAFLLDTFPSPTETFIARDIEALRRHGLEVEIFALHAGEGARPIEASFSLSRAGRGLWEKIAHVEGREGYFQELGAAWWRELAAFGATQGITHIHAGWASHPASIAWGAAKESDLPWSFSGHARDVFVNGGNLVGKLGAARFAAVCTRAAALHLQGLMSSDAGKIIYAPHGVPVDEMAFSPWQPSGEPRLLSVGRLVEKKGFGSLLDAYAILQAREFAFSACIIGEGPLREELLLRRDRLDLKSRVQFPGAMPPSEIFPTMHASHCLIVPSRHAADGDRDGLPNVILEAAACGLPLVATRAGAIEEFVDETTGILCKAGRAEELADAIEAVFRENEETESRRQAARRRVESDFDSFNNASRFLEAFKQGQGAS